MAGSGAVVPDGGVLMRRSLQASLTELPGLVEEAEAVLADAGVSADIGLQFVIAFDEVFTNLASHGRTVAGRDVVADVLLQLFQDRVQATIIDDGPPFDMTAIPDPDLAADLEARTAGGLGLFIVRNIMDEVIHDRFGNRNRLVLIKRLQERSDPGTLEE